MQLPIEIVQDYLQMDTLENPSNFVLRHVVLFH